MKMQMSSLLAMIILVFIFLIIPVLILVFFYKKTKALKIISTILFVAYILSLCVLVFSTIKIKKDIITVVIESDASWFSMDFHLAVLKNKRNVLYNYIIMFPISAFILAITKTEKFNYKKAFLLTILTSFLLSVFIETLQFILPVDRSTEVFDLFANTVSGAFGFCYYGLVVFVCESVLNKLHKQEDK